MSDYLCPNCGPISDDGDIECLHDSESLYCVVCGASKEEMHPLTSAYTHLQSEVERLRDRLADAEANWPQGKYIPGRVTEVVNPTAAHILRKQAEAVEAWLNGGAEMGGLDDYAQRLRQQAAEKENGD